MNTLKSTIVLTAVTFTASCAHPIVGSAPARDSVADFTAGFPANVERDITTLRTATNPFHDLAAAQAAGYPTTTPGCVADSTMGGMGRHYLDRKIFDDTLDIRHPEMVIYAPDGGGKFKLVGVEYAVPFSLRPSTATPPRLFGQEFRRHEQFKYWYLHVWAWEKNPAGLFADWNPLVKC